MKLVNDIILYMYKTIMQSLRQWNANHNERSKLQHGYLAATVATILIAGLVGLVDYDFGQRLTTVALMLLGVFFINLIAWTLLSGLVLSALDEPKGSSKKPGAKKK